MIFLKAPVSLTKNRYRSVIYIVSIDDMYLCILSSCNLMRSHDQNFNYEFIITKKIK